MKTGTLKIAPLLFTFVLLISCDITSNQNNTDRNPTVLFDPRGGTFVRSQYVGKNATVAEPEDPVRICHAFSGWYREPSCATLWDFENDTVTEDMTLYAGWTARIPSGLSEFALMNSQLGSPYRLDIVYNREFSGEVSYIVSAGPLAITSADEFDASTADKTTTTITADDLVYDDYITLGSLSPATTYHVYVKSGAELKSLSRTTYTVASAGHSPVTGTVVGDFGPYDYTITFPENYYVTREKWPFLLSMKTWGFSNPNLPCVVFSIDIHSGSEGDYTEIEKVKKIVSSFIRDPENGIDPERLYMAGYSAGGCAAMLMADNMTMDTSTHQWVESGYTLDVNAILAEGVTSWLRYHCENLGDVDIWLFYGEDDSLINTSIIEELETLTGTGEHMQTIMPGEGHTSWPMIDSPHTMMWLLSR